MQEKRFIKLVDVRCREETMKKNDEEMESEMEVINKVKEDLEDAGEPVLTEQEFFAFTT